MPTAYDYRPITPQECELVRRFLVENGWAHRVTDQERFAKMMHETSRSVAVWNDGVVVGFGRALCDGISNGYLSVVVVAKAAQGQGIGREIVRRLMGGNPDITWVVRAGHGSERFWSKVGFTVSEVAMERTRNKSEEVNFTRC